MTSYYGVKIDKSDDYLKLTELLDMEFGPKEIGNQLKNQITNAVKFLLIEHDYVDKDYRSTFYNFYSKMGRHYRDDCVRIHFFDNFVGFNEELTDLTCEDGQIKDHYFGFIVLRPTIVATLGRSILSPDIRVGARGKVIQSRHRVHLLGHILSVWGFPSMAQHTDISVCAHVCCWAILRHYSERFSAHREILLHDVTRLATPFDPGGLTPSFGLDIVEAERIFQAVGCFPVIIKKQSIHDLDFYAQLLAYLESGFPLFIAMRKHAIVAAGYAWRGNDTNKSPGRNIYVWSKVDTLLAVDDNLLPYRCVKLKEAGKSRTNSESYTAEDFNAFIVPLPEKIYYPATAVHTFSTGPCYTFLKERLDLPGKEDLVLRYFITTISAYRRFARENNTQIGDVLLNRIMCLQSVQFIWIVEYASHSQWTDAHISSRVIIDATASPRDRLPIWLAHNERQAIVFNRSSAREEALVIDLKRPMNMPLGRMEQNLRPVKA